MKPKIEYAPGTVSDPPQLDIGGIHDFHASPAPTIDPGSTADIGSLGTPDDGDHSIGDIGHGPSGVIPSLTDPAYDDAPPTTSLPATSAIAGTPPWLNPPPIYTSPFQVFDPSTGEPTR
jgi:hypothetical protein